MKIYKEKLSTTDIYNLMTTEKNNKITIMRTNPKRWVEPKTRGHPGDPPKNI
jgi:hypothetical protein